MIALAPAVRGKLAACLRLVETDSGAPDGERLAALAAIERVLAANGHRLHDLAGAPHDDGDVVHVNGGADWRDLLARCAANEDRLSAWEQAFVGSLWGRRRITPKQFAKLQEIVAGLGAGEGAR